jgi:adenylate cyclase class 2
MLEVELKARIDDPGAVRERLYDMQAVYECAVTERDLYFNSPSRDFGETDEALRLREAGGHYTLTYKGSRKTGHLLKAREEIICGVESAQTMEKILIALGFKPVAEVRKRREYYHVRGATVTLDSVEGLGDFIEIELESPAEVPASHLLELAASLGVTGKPIQDSYLELLEKSRKKEL